MKREDLSSKLFLVGLAVMAISLPFSEFGMSQSQFILAASWVIKGNYIGSLKKVFAHPVAKALIFLYAIHLIFLYNTIDYSYAAKDLRIKLPLLLLPLFVFSFERPSYTALRNIFGLFVVSVVAASFIGIYTLYFSGNGALQNTRDASIFISHIRFALMVCMSIVIVYHYQLKSNDQTIIGGLLIIWLVLFLILFQSMTGLIILCLMLIYFIIIWFRKGKRNRWFLILYLIPLVLVVYTYNIYKQVFVYAKPAPQTVEYTEAGNQYEHLALQDCENGFPVFQYIAHVELQSVWLRANNGDSSCLSSTNYMTLIRYMTSKGLRKDSASFGQLNKTDLFHINNGLPNVRYADMLGVERRLYETTWELYMFGMYQRAAGHSFTQRLDYWKSGLNIFKQNFWFGVGTGDIELAFKEEYIRSASLLPEAFRLRSHNQYLTFAITFGIFGFIAALFCMLWPLRLAPYRNTFYLFFFLISLSSFISEDTLETQAGVSFFAFFYCLSSFYCKSKNQIKKSDL